MKEVNGSQEEGMGSGDEGTEAHLVPTPHSLFALFALFASSLPTVFLYVAKPLAAATCINRNFYPATSVNDQLPGGHGVTACWSRRDHMT